MFFVSWFKRLHLTYSRTTSFLLISQFCNPHGNGHTLPQKLTARLVVVVASSTRETGRRRREEKEGQGRWDEEPGEVEM